MGLGKPLAEEEVAEFGGLAGFNVRKGGTETSAEFCDPVCFLAAAMGCQR